MATQIFFMFTPKIGKDSHFDEHIFQRGWFNHQAEFEWLEGELLFRISVSSRFQPLVSGWVVVDFSYGDGSGKKKQLSTVVVLVGMRHTEKSPSSIRFNISLP